MSTRILVEHSLVLGLNLARMLARRALRGPLRPSWTLRTEIAQTALRATVLRTRHKGVPWMREIVVAAATPSRFLDQVVFAPTELGGVSALDCRPCDASDPERHILYLHGGAFLFGSPASYRHVLARLAVQAKARVVGLDYRLAPEHPFPAAHDDALAAARALLEEIPPERLVVMGDSAGGNLSVATLCSLRDAGVRAAAGVLICPWTDPWARGGSLAENAPCDMGSEALIQWWTGQIGGSPEDTRLRVTAADLSGLPPLLVQWGEAEQLGDQIRGFVENARAADAELVAHEFPDMFHVFQISADVLPEGAAAMDEIAAFVRQQVK